MSVIERHSIIVSPASPNPAKRIDYVRIRVRVKMKIIAKAAWPKKSTVGPSERLCRRTVRKGFAFPLGGQEEFGGCASDFRGIASNGKRVSRSERQSLSALCGGKAATRRLTFRAGLAKKISVLSTLLVLAIFVCFSTAVATSQQTKSIGGKEHDDNILGVTIGMSVPDALKAVFVNANRAQGQEKPDAMRHEGKDDKDIRVVYNDLKVGKLQIVFAGGKWVKEILLEYAARPLYDELRLAPNGDIGAAMGGQRYDDRYTIRFTDEPAAKRQRIWYRDETCAKGFRERIEFISGRKPDDGSIEGKQITRKVILIVPGDEEKFLTAMEQ